MESVIFQTFLWTGRDHGASSIQHYPALYHQLSKWLMLTMPIVFLFYKENGLATQDLFLLKAIYSFAIVLFEEPSGYFGDIWGRKSSLVLGSVLGFILMGMISFSG